MTFMTPDYLLAGFLITLITAIIAPGVLTHVRSSKETDY